MSRKSNSRAEAPLDGMENEPEEQDMLSADVLALHQSLAKLGFSERNLEQMRQFYLSTEYQGLLSSISELLQRGSPTCCKIRKCCVDGNLLVDWATTGGVRTTARSGLPIALNC